MRHQKLNSQNAARYAETQNENLRYLQSLDPFELLNKGIQPICNFANFVENSSEIGEELE